MCGDPDAEDGNVDACNDESSAPFELSDGAFMFGDYCDSVDNDLHEQLNLEDPKEKDEEKHRNGRGYNTVQENPADDGNGEISGNLTP